MVFNEAQIRYIVATCEYMDESLEKPFRAATGEANDRALCPQFVLDLPLDQQASLKAEMASFRKGLQLFLNEQRIARQPTISATNAFKDRHRIRRYFVGRASAETFERLWLAQ